jgi:hypothetical protein
VEEGEGGGGIGGRIEGWGKGKGGGVRHTYITEVYRPVSSQLAQHIRNTLATHWKHNRNTEVYRPVSSQFVPPSK